MLATCNGFLLLLHNLAFGKVSEIMMNGFIRFVAISVSRQSVSLYRVLNVQTRCISIHLIVAKFLLCIVDIVGYVQSSFWFKVETDVGINGCFAPFWLLRTHYLNLAAWFDW